MKFLKKFDSSINLILVVMLHVKEKTALFIL
jgi:hypothetical protein